MSLIFGAGKDYVFNQVRNLAGGAKTGRSHVTSTTVITSVYLFHWSVCWQCGLSNGLGLCASSFPTAREVLLPFACVLRCINVVFFKEFWNFFQLSSHCVLKLSSVALGGFQSHRFLCCHLKLSVIKAFQDILCVSFSCQFSPDLEGTRGEPWDG